MKSCALFRLLVLVLLVPGALARSAEPIYATLTANGTAIPGDGPNGVIVALGFDHEVVLGRDAATGQATGARQYKPIRIVKAIDKSSPMLHQILTQNQNCALELRFYRKGTNGQPEHYYTVTLANARMSAMRQWKPNTRDLSADRAGDLEEVSFVFQTITWTYVNGGVTFTDTWSAQ
jgi:type VI secretion system secreted protein Hcp